MEPEQYDGAVELFSKHPDTLIVLNHIGCPQLSHFDSNDSVFWTGLRKLAALPQCTIKLSMALRVTNDWDQHKAIMEGHHKIIEMFGPERYVLLNAHPLPCFAHADNAFADAVSFECMTRCFFASNFPVDIALGWPAKKLFPVRRALDLSWCILCWDSNEIILLARIS